VDLCVPCGEALGIVASELDRPLMGVAVELRTGSIRVNDLKPFLEKGPN
jgi:hypothetical protein